MAPNEHLLDNFSASKETRSRGGDILRLAQAKTAPGSGRELRELTAGLPAACILVASEELKNGDVQKKYAQTASCLKPKDFKRVYDIVQAIVVEKERAATVTYDQLHSRYKTASKQDYLQGFITEAENELIPLGTGYDVDSNMIKCAAYFWVLNAVDLKATPGTESFAQQHELPTRRFINIVELMNTHCRPLRKKIKDHVKQNLASSTKVKTAASVTTTTPRHSPRKAASTRELPSNDTPREMKLQEDTLLEDSSQNSPVRRSARSTASLYGTSTSPTKVGQPSTPFKPWKKAPTRELPTRDSPKKRGQEPQQDNVEDSAMEVDDLPQTPSKKRRTESPTKSSFKSASSAFLAAVSTPTSSRLLDTSQTKEIPQPTTLFPSTSSRSSSLKQTRTAENDLSSSESESEEYIPTRRFRPIYLDLRQWNSGDPRMARIWRKAGKYNSLSGTKGHSMRTPTGTKG